MQYRNPLQPGNIYHLFNHANGNDKLFVEEENYHYFLDKLKIHLQSFFNVFTYSLMPNHFHLVVRVKSEEILTPLFESVKRRKFDENKDNLSIFAIERVGNLLNSYAKSFNKKYKRMGSLFMQGTKRRVAENDGDVRSMIFYVHKNAVHHGLKKIIGEWPHDGYNELLSNSPTWLDRESVFDFFDSREGFVEFHKVSDMY